MDLNYFFETLARPSDDPKSFHPALLYAMYTVACCVGAGNSYGHPTPETLAALHAAVPHVYRTDRDGTVTLTVGSGGAMGVATAR